jgi:hypothetical protein
MIDILHVASNIITNNDKTNAKSLLLFDFKNLEKPIDLSQQCADDYEKW